MVLRIEGKKKKNKKEGIDFPKNSISRTSLR